MKKFVKPLLAFGLTMVVSLNLLAQDRDYTYKAIFVYNFIKYIEWPAAGQQFKIGVLNGTPEVMTAFEKMIEKKSGEGQKIVLENYNSATAVSNCNILFIPDNQSTTLAEVSAKMAGKPTLIVTEADGLIKKGSGINFIVVDGKLRFELNRSTLKSADLKVSSNLLGLAILV
jgi:hypothetical protein